MEYFYTPPSQITHDSLTIEGDEFSHLTHVMRKRAGDAIRVVDGVGRAYDVTVTVIEKRIARCTIQDRHSLLHEPALDVTIAAGLLRRASSFDFLVEKCTELGVNAILPLLTERTIPQGTKTDRWQKLALAAMKQSGRCVLPRVHEPERFETCLSSARPSCNVIPHEQTQSPFLADVLRENTLRSVTILIGPEGGFSDVEIALAIRAGFTPVSLGARRLRSETAAIIASGMALLGSGL